MRHRNHHFTSRVLALGASSTLALALGTASAGAEQAATSSGPIETVVVTAQFTEQNLQVTPLAITAVSGQELQDRGVYDLSQLGKQVPGLSLTKNTAPFGSGVQVYIRGVGQYDTAFAAEPGVGMYIDNVYYGTLFGSSLELFDLSQVEVDRGPQGVLGGKNNIGGAIRMTSAKPEGGNTGYVDFAYGSRDELIIRGMADLTIIPDKLFLRVSAVSRDQNGYVDVIDYACKFGPGTGPTGAGSLPVITQHVGCKDGTQGGTNVAGARAAARWVFNAHMEDTVSVDMLRDNSDIQPSTLVVVDTGNSDFVYVDRNGHPKAVTREQFYGLNSDGLVQVTQFAAAPDGQSSAMGIDTWNNVVNIPSYGIPWDQRFMTDPFKRTYQTYISHEGQQYTDGAQVHAWGASNVFDWDIADNIHFKNITGWRYYTSANSDDNDVSPLSYELTTTYPTNREFQEEGRFTGSLLDNKLQWVLGAFYYHRINRATGPVVIEGALAPFLVFEQNDEYQSTSESVFAHAIYNVWDNVDIFGGFRYSREKKIYFFDHSGAVPGYPGSGFFRDTVDPSLNCDLFEGHVPCDHTIHPPLVANTVRSARPDWRAGVDWRINPDDMVYFQFSTGYRTGGFNSRPFDPLQLTSFGPEELKSYEVGAKTDWWDHRVRFNISAFYADYSHIITPIAETDAFHLPDVAYFNLGSSKNDGFEAELTAAPIENMLINFTYSLVHADPSAFPGAPAGWINGCSSIAFSKGICPQISAGTVRKGSHAILVPDRQAHFDIQYTWNLPNWGSLTPYLDWNWQSIVYEDANNNPYTAIPAHGIWDARLTWDAPAGGWQVSAQVTNLADKQYFLNMFDLAIFGQGSVQAEPAPGREWLVELRKTF